MHYFEEYYLKDPNFESFAQKLHEVMHYFEEYI